MTNFENTLKEISGRRSVRKFSSDPVKDEDVLQILEAARLAPSGSNTQPWRFIVVKSPEVKEKIVSADHDQRWMLSAPVFIVCLADMRCRMENYSGAPLDEGSALPELKQLIRDTSIAISYLLLEAEHLGLATCWTGWYEQSDMRKALDLPDEFYICGVVPLGYADESPAARPRLPLNEIVRYEKW